jgi:xanthine dehydrogenase accessory factor
MHAGWDWLSRLDALRRSSTPAALVTVTGGTGSAPRDAGAKMVVLEDGSFFGTIGGGHLEKLAIEEACKLILTGESKTIRYPLGAKTGQCCGGVVDLFFEILNTGPDLYLFGAGHVGQAIARTLEGTPFTVHVIDERGQWVQAPQLPAGVVRHECEWDEFVSGARFDQDRTYVSILTFRHDLDEKILEDILRHERPTRYLGLIGSRAKWERFKQRLTQRGLPEAALGRVRSPIGIEIGGKSPQEIAISLAAELLGIHHGKFEYQLESRRL